MRRGRPARSATTAPQVTGMALYSRAAVSRNDMAAFNEQYPPSVPMRRVRPRNNNNNNNGKNNNNVQNLDIVRRRQLSNIMYRLNF